MRRIAAVALALAPLLAACASHADRVRNSVAAVVQEESARQTVVDAIQKGATPDQAMDKVAGGPKHEKPGPQ
jgi:hypothetical protein